MTPQQTWLRICPSRKGGEARHGGWSGRGLLVSGLTRHWGALRGESGVSILNGCWDSALSSKLPVLAEPGG